MDELVEQSRVERLRVDEAVERRAFDRVGHQRVARPSALEEHRRPALEAVDDRLRPLQWLVLELRLLQLGQVLCLLGIED